MTTGYAGSGVFCITSVNLIHEIRRIKVEGTHSVRTVSGTTDDRREGKLGGPSFARFSYGPGIMQDALLTARTRTPNIPG